MDELQKSASALLDSIKELTSIDDELLNDESMEQVMAYIDSVFEGQNEANNVKQIVNNFAQLDMTKQDAIEAIAALKEYLTSAIYGETVITGNKKKIVDYVTEQLFGIFDKAVERYHSYDIELPIKLEEGAQMPTYAHETDAAADLYALEDTNLNAHTYGNKVRTGVSIQLPEGWLAMILPRSSIGVHTPFRLSNSVGLIDSKKVASQWAA